MIERRGRLALLTVPVALALAACASSTSVGGVGSVGSSASAGTGGSGTSAAPSGTSSAGSSSSGGSSSGSSSSSGAGASGETLAAELHSGVSRVQTAHFALNITAAGQSITGSGDEKLSGGKVTAMKLTENLPGGAGAISIVLVDGKTYLKLPASLNKSGKPWLLATASSSNAVVRSVAKSLSSTLSSASIGSVGAFVDAATSIKTVGRETINGAPATRLHIVVDVAKLAKTLPNGEALEKAGLSTLPIDMWLDDEHRPVQVLEDFSVGSQHVSTKVSISRYNQPVTISAPPASQVGH